MIHDSEFILVPITLRFKRLFGGIWAHAPVTITMEKDKVREVAHLTTDESGVCRLAVFYYNPSASYTVALRGVVAGTFTASPGQAVDVTFHLP
jgi:hypothetical protein